MRTVTFQSVLHGTARLLGLNPNRDLNTDRAATLTEYLNTAIRPAWQYDWWPECLSVEERRFCGSYTPGEFLQAGDQRYHAGSDKYYQALQLQLAATEAPATYASDVWTENSAWWAELKTSYDAPDQVSGEALAVGDQRRDLNSGIRYQIITAHTTSSVTVDTAQAGVLTAFRRTIDLAQVGQTPIGAVKGVYERDPGVYARNPGKLNHTVTSRGVVITSARVPATVWVEFRQRPPQFTSTPWVSGTAYDRDALVYYRPTGFEGDVFLSLVGDNDEALENESNWALVEFPLILAEHCKLLAAGLALSDQKQNDRARDLRDQAQLELERVREQEITSQQEPEAAEVATYGGR